MFRQVLVRKEDRAYQRIVWRAEPEQPIAIYELNTVTYGTGPATFLTTRCLADVARQFEDVYPQASKALLNDTYVDDVITGAQTVQEAIRLRSEMMNIMKNGCFRLRKWSSNDPKVLEMEEPSVQGKHFLKDVAEKKTLGVVWEQTTDALRFTAEKLTMDVKSDTKRTILSTIARVFDPLGLLSPVIVNAKILLQQLWSQKLSWDEPIPDEVQTKWDWLKRQINDLDDIQVPRRVFCKDVVSLRLCGFCDSSEKAYGAAIYCRTEDAGGNVHVSLLCSKSRVAPVKTISLPRLELSGALLLAKLMRSALNALDEKTVAVSYFTDSTIVLDWLNSEPTRWKQFVANRVSKIQTLSDPTCWNHVAGKDNPADVVSRGTSTQKLRQSNWWTGPSFLTKDPSEWTTSYVAGQKENEEERRTKVTLTATTHECSIAERYSTLNKAVRVTAYCLRFYKNTKYKHNANGPLTATEMQEALTRLVRLCQHENFMTEINDLKARGRVQTTSRLVALAPYLDKDKILRVGGRLNYSDVDDNTKNPIILPKGDFLTKLIIRHEHDRNYHAGAQATLAAVRQKYWPIAGMATVKGEVRKCVICFKFAPRNTPLQMAPLPEERVTPSQPFTHTALDMAGPFPVKQSKFRNKRLIKSYACIFVCFASKAIHIELVTDLSCETFLTCIQRFVARRGMPKTLYSDNGRSFVAASKEIKQAYKALLQASQGREISAFIAENNINWKFMPPRSPHFGGLHEAAVKSMKRHLKRITKNITLTYETLVTLLTRIEAILNSRPLYAISNHPNDLTSLTPGHFLIGRPLNALPDETVDEPRSYKLSDYNKLSQITRSFWERWRKEYLVSLQGRVKWRRAQKPSIQVGDLVLMKEENTPSQCWPMGRITDLHPGADGCARVATVKTKNGTTQRATERLYVLPLEED